jgi:hypothetical protein
VGLVELSLDVFYRISRVVAGSVPARVVAKLKAEHVLFNAADAVLEVL